MDIEVRNYTKVRVLFHLKKASSEAASATCERLAWQAPASIANSTGVNVASLYIILKRWRSNTWGYVEALHFNAEQMADLRPHWLYKINTKGLAYLTRLHKWYEPLEAVLASVALYEEQHEDYCGRDIIPRVIEWHVKPSEMATCIEWPFRGKADTHPAMAWFPNCLRVKSLEEASNMASVVFGITPSKECLRMARAWQNHYVQEELDKLAQGAGFVTTEGEG